MRQNRQSTLEGFNSIGIRDTIIIGAILRVLFLCLVFIMSKSGVDPYFITDDIKYERLAELYVARASSPFDNNTFTQIGASDYLQVFWPWVLCVSSYITHSIYAGRIINILLSTICIYKVYELTYNISGSYSCAKKSAKLIAYLPVTIITCCFPIKDIFLMYAAVYYFNIAIKFRLGKICKIREIVTCIILMIGVYFTRGGVVELFGIFAGIYVCDYFIRKKDYLKLVIAIFVIVGLLFFFFDDILAAFNRKILDYGDYALANSTISSIQMSSIVQIYKLPFSYLFATLQPMKVQLFSYSGISIWYAVLATLNISIYPIAIGNFIYIFKHKHDFLFWVTSSLMYVAIISLSLGIFRHYLFLIFLEIINFSLLDERKGKYDKLIIAVGCTILLTLVVIISL